MKWPHFLRLYSMPSPNILARLTDVLDRQDMIADILV
jgi:hypothetical protein